MTKLGDVCTKIGSGATPRGGKEAYKPAGIPIIRSQNVLDWSFSEAGLAFIDTKQAAALASAEVRSGDVLLNITGDSVARACMVPPSQTPARVNQHVSILRAGEKVDPMYLLCFIQSRKAHLLKLASSGATRNALTKGMLEALTIELPALSQQRAIASVVAAIQARIALNNQINGYLAELLDASYSLVTKNGTEVKTLPEVVDIFSGGTPKTGNSEYWESGNIPFFTPGDVTRSVYTLTTEKHITETGLANCNSSLYPIDTVFLTARGTVGKVAIAGNPMAMNQSCFAFRGKAVPQSVVFQVIKYAVKSLKAKANGATFAAINTRDLGIERVAIPSKDAMHAYDRNASVWLSEILANEKENLRLANLRDALLPKLMSGEIDASKVDLTQPNSHLSVC